MASPVKALLVEDTRVDALVLSTMLRRFHCEITIANNGKKAVDLFLEGNKFDIVLCDNDMPIMTGPEAVEKIRAMGEIDVKIIGLSANNNVQDVFMTAGVDVFVPKPLKIDVLGAMIQEVINKKNNAMV
uniref:Uncharacterized protein n=1 Tax=Avena sativa TaxID=4498 RepID=A0ACD5YB74_AVESA